MNIFSLIGDLFHLSSILILLLKIYTTKNVRGISLYTQILYLTVFVCRYTDIFYNFYSIYMEVMKIIFITTSASIVYIMTMIQPYKSTYDIQYDKQFNILFILVPCSVLSLLFTAKYTVTEILWTFSIILESVSIIPQLLIVHKYASEHNGFVENLTSHYVFTLGGYRAMYIINWIYHFIAEPHYTFKHNWLVWLCGIVQTGIYCDFFYYYLNANIKGEKMSLPI